MSGYTGYQGSSSAAISTLPPYAIAEFIIKT